MRIQCNPTRIYREPDSGAGLQTSRLTDEGSAKSPGGTHLLESRLQTPHRLGGAIFRRKQF